jgi:hypothetical protein
MKEHILSALREQFDRWEELLGSLSEQQITAPHFDLGWSIQDVMAHLWAWQQISITRMESGALNQEPKYPDWIVGIGKDWEENADRVNALTFESNHKKAWSLGDQISERDLLDGDKYSWLQGYSRLSFLWRLMTITRGIWKN